MSEREIATSFMVKTLEGLVNEHGLAFVLHGLKLVAIAKADSTTGEVRDDWLEESYRLDIASRSVRKNLVN